MSTPFTRTRITWMAYALLALYAYFLNILGPITPFLHDELGLSYTASSLHFSAFAVGILVIGFAGGPVIRRLGRERSLAAGALGLGLGALLLVTGRAAVITIGAAFLMGCVGSLILAVVPAALSQEHGESRSVAISEANVLSSLLSTAAPLLVGGLARLVVGWRLALIGAALLIIALGVVLIRSGGGKATENAAQEESAPAAQEGSAPAAQEESAPAAQEESVSVEPARHGTRLPFLFWFYWLNLVLAVSVEFCMVFWSADYLASTFNLPQASAAQAVSLFLAGMIVGRMVSGQVVRRIAARVVVLASLLLGLLGFLLYWSSGNVLLVLVGLAVTGLGVAGLYPLLISLAIGAAGGQEAQAGSRTALASGTAILLLPLVLGRLADFTGLKAAFGVVAVLFAGMLVLITAHSPSHYPLPSAHGRRG